MNIEKLPKWAQQHIRDLSRQRDTAINALNKYVDEQTSSPFFIDELKCTGETKGPTRKRRYIDTYKMSVNHAGVNIDILLRDEHIDISWGNPAHKDIAMIPASHQQVRLVSAENMRK